MAGQNATSKVTIDLGNEGRKAVMEARNAETVKPGGGHPPKDITGGVAQVTSCKIDKFKTGDLKGKPFIAITAVVVEPKEYNGMRVAGTQIRWQEPLCATPARQGRKTLANHVKHIMNFFRLLGISTEDMTDEKFNETPDEITALKPYVQFRTWQPEPATKGKYKGKPTQVQSVWEDCLPDYEGAAAEEEVGEDNSDAEEDETAEKEDSTEESTDETETEEGEAEGESEEGGDEEAAEEEDEEQEGSDDEPDLDDLLKRAQGGNNEARKEIGKLGKKLGIGPKVDKAPNWFAAIKLIKEKMKEDGGGEEESAEEEAAEEPEEEAKDDTPSEGDLFFYKPKDKNGKRAAKGVKCEVVSVVKKSKTATIKSMKKPITTYKAVPWKMLSDKA